MKTLAQSRLGAALSAEMLHFIHDELGLYLRGELLLVALSGGADSTALLVMLCALQKREGFRLAAAHLDHGLRPESRAEAAAVRVLCESLGVRLVEGQKAVGEIAASHGLGLEEAGRKVRYAFLEEARALLEAAWILTGHHIGDLAEDVLLRLTRGTAWPGLGGMRAVHGKLLRPLLLIEKIHLIGFLEEMEIPWSVDASNHDLQFKRNRMRQNILPLLLAENPGFYDVVRTLWRSARLDEMFWNEYLAAAVPNLTPINGQIHLPRDVLNVLPPAARIRIFVRILQTINLGQARANTLYALEKSWRMRKYERVFQFPGDVQAKISREGICWSVITH